MKPGTLVTIFDLYPGVVMKSPPTPGRVMVTYQMTNGTKVCATIALADVTERKKHGASQALAT